MKKKIELLAPAGNMEKLKIAIKYGANAIYLSGKQFSLRNFSNNFSTNELLKARILTKKNNIKMYIAINTFSRNYEEKIIFNYMNEVKSINPDAIIVADPGIFIQAKELINNIPIHISTQSNITNTKTAKFWKNLGAKRINTARELSLEEIKQITKKTTIEVETFVHGSMCIAYSGKCIISNYMLNRGSNEGMCAQPCRFKYVVMETKNPSEYFPISEDNNGTYIFSSKDLCMIEYIPELINTGIKSLKIEGRMKTINYLATTVKTYRKAIDTYYENPNKYNKNIKKWCKELNKINNRGFTTGFFFKNLNLIKNEYLKNKQKKNILLGKVISKTHKKKVLINVRNKFYLGDRINVLTPGNKKINKSIISEIIDEKGIYQNFANTNSNVYIKINTKCNQLDLIQKNT